MQQRRSHSNTIMPNEVKFTHALRDAAACAGANGLDAHLVQLLVAAWQQLHHSGVLRMRGIEGRFVVAQAVDQDFQAAVQKSLAAPDLRACALPGCGAREAHPAHFKSCAACRTVVYCSKAHQVEGWPAHKKACKAARKKAAAVEDAAGPCSA